MKYVKFVLPLLLLFAVASCRKSGVKPTTPIDTDLLIHQIKFGAPTQFAAAHVSGDTLKVIYYENVSLFIPSTGLNLSFALHLKEDFSGSAMRIYDYTTVDAYGDVDFDWVDDNLNNVTAKTEKDTVVAGVPVTKITVRRPFTFSKAFASAAIATSKEDSIVALTKDSVRFSSYVYFGKTYPATTQAVNLLYVKQ